MLANYQQSFVAAPPNLSEPIGFDVLPDGTGRVIQTDRRGGVRLHDPATNTTTLLATIPVYIDNEDGMYGPEVDNNFNTNKWVYLFYSPPTVEDVKFADGDVHTVTTPLNDPATPQNEKNAPNFASSLSAWDPYVGYFQLSRFKFVEATATTPAHLDLASEQQILRVENNRGACCHVAGDIDFDSKNNLWMVTGDDTPAGGGNSGGFGPFNDQLTNESQTLAVANATGGTFTLTFDGQTTAPIRRSRSTTLAIEAALEALSNLDDVAVTGNGHADDQLPRQRGRDERPADDRRRVGPDRHDARRSRSRMATINNGQGVNIPAEGGLFNAPHVDARRTAQNTGDLRGKLLRIKVKEGDIAPAEANAFGGAYTVPAGNLFPVGTARTRPEIYAMGFRNPFRITLDKNDVAYVSDYSPDSQARTNFRGPAGTGRFEIVRKPANYGWPLCYKTDLPYYKWDFNTSTPLPSAAAPELHECDNPTRGPQNTSRWVANGGPAVEPGLEYGPPIKRRRSGTRTATTRPAERPAGDAVLRVLQTAPASQRARRARARSSSRSCSRAASVRTARRRTTTTPPTRARRSSRRTGTGRSSSVSSRRTPCARSARLAGQGLQDQQHALPCGPAPATPTRPWLCDNPMDMEFGPDGNLLPADLRRRLLRHQPGRRDDALASTSRASGRRSSRIARRRRAARCR